jgi:uncharacterized protein
MIIDAHVHLHGSVFHDDHERSGVSSLLAALDEAGIQKAVVHSLDPLDNQDILLECALNRDRLSSFIVEYPDSPGLNKIPAYIAMGICGIGEIYVHPGSTYTLSSYLEPLIEVAKSNHLPILLHTGDFSYTAPLLILETIRSNPEIDFILGHMGSMHYVLDAIEILKTFSNVYADTSGMCSTLMLQRAVAECGAEKLLFASDYPYWHPRVELRRIYVANLGKKAEQKILGENVARLLKI